MTAVTTTEWQTAPKPVSRPLYAIGDVHGAADLLEALQAKLVQLEAKGVLVYLGDLIDPYKHVRNYNCAKVLDAVARGVGHDGLEEHVLMGNHDQFFTLALEAARTNGYVPYDPGTWASQGGVKTAQAWGIWDERNERVLAGMLWNRMSNEQRGVFEKMKVYVEHDAYLLVHAGFCDFLPLPEQLSKNWRAEFPLRVSEEIEHPFWMRLDDEDIAPKGRVLIVGHTPRRRAFVGTHHIGIDTSVKSGGPLTMLEIVGDRMRFHQAWSDGVTQEAWEQWR